MMEAVTVFVIVVGTFLVTAILARVGYRWIDKMLLVQPPIDPNKPIVRP